MEAFMGIARQDDKGGAGLKTPVLASKSAPADPGG